MVVPSATKAEKAIKILKKEKPKIVFLDMLMPDVKGFNLLREMKMIDPGIIVIMVTAKGDDQTQKEALENGADEFVKKPFSHNYLRDIVVDKIKDVLDKGGYMQKPAILVVDDESQARENLKNFIEPRFICDIQEAEDGQTAIEKSKNLQPDIILLDVKMPGISGIEAIGKIKEVSPHSRIIVISAWSSSEVVSQAIRAGASDYIGKPISLITLSEKLRSALISIGKLIVKKS